MNNELLRSERASDALSMIKNEAGDEGFATFLLFGLGARVYATDVTNVREIVDLSEIQPLPNASSDVFGMIDLRNQSIPVIDLAARMQVDAHPSDEARIIVFEFNHSNAVRLLGIVADRVISVSEIAMDNIETLTHAISGWKNDGVLGVIRSDNLHSLVLKIEHYLDDADLPGEFEFDA